jgi:hypothetical protein
VIGAFQRENEWRQAIMINRTDGLQKETTEKRLRKVR